MSDHDNLEEGMDLQVVENKVELDAEEAKQTIKIKKFQTISGNFKNRLQKFAI